VPAPLHPQAACTLADALPALGYSRAAVSTGYPPVRVDLFHQLYARGLGALRTGGISPAQAAAWLRGLRRIAPLGGVPAPQLMSIAGALADSLAAAVVADGDGARGGGGGGGRSGGSRGGSHGSDSGSAEPGADAAEESDDGAAHAPSGGRSGRVTWNGWPPNVLAEVLLTVTELGPDTSGEAAGAIPGGGAAGRLKATGQCCLRADS
jgi:hypothetical protein